MLGEASRLVTICSLASLKLSGSMCDYVSGNMVRNVDNFVDYPHQGSRGQRIHS